MTIQAGNLTGYFNNGIAYTIKLIHRRVDGKMCMYAELYCFYEKYKKWIYESNLCKMYDRVNYVIRLRELLDACSKKWGVQLLKSKLQIVS